MAVRLTLDVQGQGGGRILDVDGQGGVGDPENWTIFKDIRFIVPHRDFVKSSDSNSSLSINQKIPSCRRTIYKIHERYYFCLFCIFVSLHQYQFVFFLPIFFHQEIFQRVLD